jgi:uncharacterized membrane protein YfcA
VTPLIFVLVVFAVSLAAGVVGSLLGLGGGIVVVPVLTLALGIDIRYAIGASIVSVIATSSGAAAAYVRQHLTNLRVAMFLEMATTTGAISGAFIAGLLDPRWLFIAFGLLLGYSAFAMLRQPRDRTTGVQPDAWADRLRLHESYFDETIGEVRAYRVGHVQLGLLLMYLAGAVSGLLGIGSGAFKVPALDLAMGLPIKVSTATSNFMIGVTAAASAGVYFSRGDIDPFVAGPVAAGVVLGAFAGSKLLSKLPASKLRIAFVAVLLLIAIQMLYHGTFGHE